MQEYFDPYIIILAILLFKIILILYSGIVNQFRIFNNFFDKYELVLLFEIFLKFS